MGQVVKMYKNSTYLITFAVLHRAWVKILLKGNDVAAIIRTPDCPVSDRKKSFILHFHPFLRNIS